MTSGASRAAVYTPLVPPEGGTFEQQSEEHPAGGEEEVDDESVLEEIVGDNAGGSSGGRRTGKGEQEGYDEEEFEEDQEEPEEVAPAARCEFTASDGAGFDDRRAYRKYEFELSYTFKKQRGSPDAPLELRKEPGAIEGQPFEMAELADCTVVLLDHSEAIQVDYLVNCRVFIGACCDSVLFATARAAPSPWRAAVAHARSAWTAPSTCTP